MRLVGSTTTAGSAAARGASHGRHVPIVGPYSTRSINPSLTVAAHLEGRKGFHDQCRQAPATGKEIAADGRELREGDYEGGQVQHRQLVAAVQKAVVNAEEAREGPKIQRRQVDALLQETAANAGEARSRSKD